MKKNCMLLFLLFVVSISSQELLPKSIYTLNSIGVNTRNLNLKEAITQQNLNAILHFNHKVNTNNVFAYIFTTFGAFGVLYGSYFIFRGINTRGVESTFNTTFGALGVLGGIAYGSISIPFWVGAKKNKERRDKLIKIYP